MRINVERNPENMKAILPTKEVLNGRNYSCDKELVNSYIAMTITHDADGIEQLVEVIDCRMWMGRSRNASVVYASIWVRDERGTCYCGHGHAGGYGYHKESAAVESAIESAGIKLYGSPYDRKAEPGSYEAIDRPCSIGGCGDQAIKSALVAICNAMGHNRVYII